MRYLSHLLEKHQTTPGMCPRFLQQLNLRCLHSSENFRQAACPDGGKSKDDGQ